MPSSKPIKFLRMRRVLAKHLPEKPALNNIVFVQNLFRKLLPNKKVEQALVEQVNDGILTHDEAVSVYNDFLNNQLRVCMKNSDFIGFMQNISDGMAARSKWFAVKKDLPHTEEELREMAFVKKRLKEMGENVVARFLNNSGFSSIREINGKEVKLVSANGGIKVITRFLN